MYFLKKYMFAISTPLALYFWLLYFQGFMKMTPPLLLSTAAILGYIRYTKNIS